MPSAEGEQSDSPGAVERLATYLSLRHPWLPAAKGTSLNGGLPTPSLLPKQLAGIDNNIKRI